jgi:hypothetical protein
MTTSDPTRYEALLKAMVHGLSLRGLMLLTLIGAFVLAWRAMGDQSYLSLSALGVYCVLGILPIAYLEIRRGQS